MRKELAAGVKEVKLGLAVPGLKKAQKNLEASKR